MKNLHLIQTDKPSRLFDDGMQLYLGELEDRKGHPVTSYNIYITNDEEIKEGDWFLSKTGIVHNNWGWNYGDKKIILTTDQSLNGVQAINDEFLEWFEKNPSCKSVHVYNQTQVGYEYDEYHFILPYDNVLNKEEPKQETLEEVAKKIYGSEELKDVEYYAFINGAKWQQEQDKKRDSEEEVETIARDAYSMGRNNILIGVFNKWFKQYKNK